MAEKKTGEGHAGGRLRRLIVALIGEDENLGSGLSSGDGGRAANCRTHSSSLQWVREGGVGGDALFCSLGTRWTVSSLRMDLASFLILNVRHSAWRVVDALWVFIWHECVHA